MLLEAMLQCQYDDFEKKYRYEKKINDEIMKLVVF